MLKKTFLLAAICLGVWACKQPNTTPPLLRGYNNNFYPTILQAAQGIGKPFFLQELLDTMPGVTVTQDSFLVYNKVNYPIHNHYENPDSGSDYYIKIANYANYGLSDSVKVLWPEKIPNALYSAASLTFNSSIDCVGYGTRILAATGSGAADTAHNAYLALGAFVRGTGDAPFASKGWVASAYQIAIAFPLLPPAGKLGWQYVSGNVMPKLIDSVNHKKDNPHLKREYSGLPKGGFANALPGDILSFGYDGGGSNGHFMVMAQAPKKLLPTQFSTYFKPIYQTLANKLSQRFNVYAVTVYDCSGKNVHFNDSRKYMSGIGHGTLFLFTDLAKDIPQGFIFEPPVKKVNEPLSIGAKLMGAPNVSTVAISVGRYTGL